MEDDATQWQGFPDSLVISYVESQPRALSCQGDKSCFWIQSPQDTGEESVIGVGV